MTDNKQAFLCQWRPRTGSFTAPFDVVVIASDSAEAASIVKPLGAGELVVTGYPVRNLPNGPVLTAMVDEMLNDLQAIGEEYGVLGGEKRTDGIRRVLKAQRSTIDLLHAICERYEEGFADPGRFMDEIRDGLGRRDPLKVALREAVTAGTGVIVVEGDGKTTTRSMREMWGDGGVASSLQHQLRTDDVAKLREIGERCLALMRETPTHTLRRARLADVHVSLVEAARKIEEAMRNVR
ncbi:hypothetical protein [Phreatobacter oligotrophus]|uniref:Uncharacterized protein n=1 Tax=Phreatobacter oligotrophus TaxID=1122261 RepID=A0A2T4ZIW9_9HYPH|nr:hypothetical protein [Phreatobacter oligotrophus]PTM61918.1 hypothetical protein C8P69_101591 [Phreatobacter oligotrophus]